MNTQETNLLFVYGTLRRQGGSVFHQVLTEHAAYLGQARFQGFLFNISHYPGVIESENASNLVIGELYKLNEPERVLQTLDSYEECSPNFPEPHEYKREIRTIRTGNNQTALAWIYLYKFPTAHLEPIRSGDYLAFLKQVQSQ